jgi:hypothetical protein
MTSMKRIVGLVGASLLWSALAGADPKTADEWYKEGENQYNLGDFDKAADAFKQGFALETTDSKKPAFLYNVAQAYRQANKCKDAVFFYKRFLSLKDSGMGKPLADDKHKEIEGLIGELDACAKNQEALAKKPPDNTMSPGGDGKTGPTTTTTGTTGTTGTPSGTKAQGTKTATAGEDNGDDDNGVHKSGTAQQLVGARFELGASKISAGNLSVPVQPQFTLIAGYPIQINPQLHVDPGVAIGFKPIPWINGITNAKQTGTMTQLMANASATYTVMPKISARGDLGLGVLMFGGISDMGNPFTQGAAGTTGALAMFAARVAVSGDYEITPNIIGTVTPFAFSFSPAKSGLRDDIKSITSIDFLVGVGYRM